jgi:hypothetical protein
MQEINMNYTLREELDNHQYKAFALENVRYEIEVVASFQRIIPQKYRFNLPDDDVLYNIHNNE